MKTRAHVTKKAASSPTKAVASKAFRTYPATIHAHEKPAPQVTSNPIRTQQIGHNQGNLLGKLQVSPKAIIQPKLIIGERGDKYEQEADSIANKVMNSAPAGAMTNQPLANSISPIAAGNSAPVQAAADGKAVSSSSNLASQLTTGNSSGSPLPQEVRAFMEPRFGVDLSSVRVHTDSTAGQINQQLRAKALTYGNHIYFGAGTSPGNNALTAHELTHVVQQTGIGSTNSSLQSAKPTTASAPAPRVQREVTEKDLKEQLGIDPEELKKATWKDWVNNNPTVSPVASHG